MGWCVLLVNTEGNVGWIPTCPQEHSTSPCFPKTIWNVGDMDETSPPPQVELFILVKIGDSACDAQSKSFLLNPNVAQLLVSLANLFTIASLSSWDFFQSVSMRSVINLVATNWMWTT